MNSSERAANFCEACGDWECMDIGSASRASAATNSVRREGMCASFGLASAGSIAGFVRENVNLVPVRTYGFVEEVGVASVSNRGPAIRNLGLEEGVLPVGVRPAARTNGPRYIVRR